MNEKSPDDKGQPTFIRAKERKTTKNHERGKG
jgi:hypothetical protein